MRHRRTQFLILLGLAAWAAMIVLWQVRLHRPTSALSDASLSASFDPNSVVFAGVLKDGIPPIDEPVFESVAAADVYLQDTLQGLAVEAAGKWRFYPYQVLVWHGAVNDTFGSLPLLVSYCPLCDAGAAFERSVNGEALSFGASGQVSDNEMLLYDRSTQSLWSPLRAAAVTGEKAGTELAAYPSIVMTWAHFKQEHSSGQVLSRATGAERDYTHNPYGSYLENNEILFPLSHADERLRAKTAVIGLSRAGASFAVPVKTVRDTTVVNASLGGQDVALWYDEGAEAVYAFDRRVNDSTYTFSWDGEDILDAETGSVWSTDGRAISGPLKRLTLERTSAQPALWFCWTAVHSETKLYGYD